MSEQNLSPCPLSPCSSSPLPFPSSRGEAVDGEPFVTRTDTPGDRPLSQSGLAEAAFQVCFCAGPSQGMESGRHGQDSDLLVPRHQGSRYRRHPNRQGHSDHRRRSRRLDFSHSSVRLRSRKGELLHLWRGYGRKQLRQSLPVSLRFVLRELLIRFRSRLLVASSRR